MPGKPDPARRLLIRDWETAFGSPPPPFLSVRFMTRALSYDAQCRANGGLPAQTRRQLRQIANGGSRSTTVTSTASLQSGSHLVREWNGRTYQVEVLPEGYCLDGRTWASLSAIARHITGAHWSGPRFFGLHGRRTT
jgi:Protein of unknown function (DUF2924)